MTEQSYKRAEQIKEEIKHLEELMNVLRDGAKNPKCVDVVFSLFNKGFKTISILVKDVGYILPALEQKIQELKEEFERL